MTTYGQNINRFRTERNLTIRQLSAMARVSESTLTSWIYRDIHPDIDGLIKLADTFNVSLDELVGREFPREEPTDD